MIKKVMVSVIIAVMLLSLFVVGASAATVNYTGEIGQITYKVVNFRDSELNPIEIDLDGYYQITFDSTELTFWDKIHDNTYIYVAPADTYFTWGDGINVNILHSIQAFNTPEPYFRIYYNTGVEEIIGEYGVQDILRLTIYTKEYPLDVNSSAVNWFARSMVVSRIGTTTTLLGSFSGILDGIIMLLGNVGSLFYLDGQLTVIGMLSILAVGIGLCLLFIGFVDKFLHGRG